MNAKDFYDATADRYDGELFAAMPYTVETRFGYLFSLLDADTPVAGWRILEIGAGTGAYSGKLADLRPARLVVTDVSGEMLQIAERKVEGHGESIEFRSCECEALPFADKSFDLVVGFACFHHFRDTAAAFSEISRVLDDSGHLLVMEPNPLHPGNFLLGLFRKIERGMMHSWPEMWRKAGERAGLRLEGFRRGSFFPGWPAGCIGIYRFFEKVLTRLPVVRNFAIFGFYHFVKAASDQHTKPE